MTLDRASACCEILWLNDDTLATMQLSASQRSGDDSADSAQSKGAIDKQARFSGVGLSLHSRKLRRKSAFQIFNSFTCAHRSGNNRGVCKRGLAQLVADLSGDVVDLPQIAFCERYHGALRPEISQNLQMLFGLRHPAVVRCDNEKCEIDRSHAGDHVSNEVL